MNYCWLEELVLRDEFCPFPICCGFNCQETVLVVNWPYFTYSGGFTFRVLMELGNHSSCVLKSKIYPSPCISKLQIIRIYMMFFLPFFILSLGFLFSLLSFSISLFNIMKTFFLSRICCGFGPVSLGFLFGFFLWLILFFYPLNKYEISKAA